VQQAGAAWIACGEPFDMPAGCMHSEQYGPEETIILLGRRYSSAGL